MNDGMGRYPNPGNVGMRDTVPEWQHLSDEMNAIAVEEDVLSKPALPQEEPAVLEPKLTEQEKARAATNNPELSELKVKIGKREFTIVDLEYDDYMFFLTKLQPLLEAVASRMAGSAGIALGVTSSLGIADLLKYCSDSIPQLALLVAQQTQPDITMAELKKLAKTPFKLAELPLAQIQQNRMIQDIGDFFVQILPLVMSRQQ